MGGCAGAGTGCMGQGEGSTVVGPTRLAARVAAGVRAEQAALAKKKKDRGNSQGKKKKEGKEKKERKKKGKRKKVERAKREQKKKKIFSQE